MLRDWSVVLMIAAILCARPVRAETTVDLKSISVPDLSRVVLKEMLHANYVLAPEVVSSDAKLSLTLGNQTRDSIVETLKDTFAAAGFTMTKKGDVYFITKGQAVQPQQQQQQQQPPQQSEAQQDQPAPDARYFTYKAKARPLSYLTKVAKFAGAKVIDGDVAGDVLVFAASEPIRKRLEAVLRVVDSPAQAVTIRAALVEFTDTTDTGNSFALSVVTNHLKSQFKAGAALANSVTFSGATVSAALSAISGDSRFSYLSQPMLRVLDGETAKLSVGSDVPVRGAITLDKNGNALQSVAYQSSGVILNVSPRIVGDLITLKVDQQISSFSANTTSNIDSPSLFKRQATTTVDIQKGQLVILAGLDEDKETESRSGLSFLPSSLWSNTNSKSKSQILLMLEVPRDDQSI